MSYKRQTLNTERLECFHVPPWDIPYAHGTDIDFREWQDNSGGVFLMCCYMIEIKKNHS